MASQRLLILRSHNKLLDSHIAFQQRVQEIRQDILKLARLPITHPIWCDAGTEEILRPPDNTAAPDVPKAPAPTPTPVPMPEATASLFTPEDSGTEPKHPDKTPMEIVDEDEEVRQALEDAQLKQALALSKQTTRTPPSTPDKNTASGSSPGTTSKQTQQQHSNTPAHQIHPPVPPCNSKTNKTDKANKTTPATPVKAKPPTKPTKQQALHSHKHTKPSAKASTAPVTPTPKRRRGKTSPAAAVVDQYQTIQADVTERMIKKAFLLKTSTNM